MTSILSRQSRQRFLVTAALAVIASFCATVPVSQAAPVPQAPGATDSFAMHRRLTGRMDSNLFYVAVQGDMFGWTPGGKSAPLFSLIGFWAMKLVPLNDGSDGYVEKRGYCGFYTKFGTREVMTSWVNPLTGAALPVKPTQLRSSAIYLVYRRDGIHASAAMGGMLLAPPAQTSEAPYAHTIVGTRFYMPEQIWIPPPATTLFFEETVWSADASQMNDGSDRFVAAERSFSNLSPGPRMTWAQLPEGSIAHIQASGQKLERIDQMPPDLVALTRANCPDIANGNLPD